MSQIVDMQKVKELVPRFNKFLKSEEIGNKWERERAEKDEFFEKYFSEKEISNLEEGTLRELIHILWAFNGWTNKDYLFDEMLKSGLPTIRSAFKNLLYGSDQIAKRFDEVRKKVRIMGAASISEILTHHDHKKYPIWNRRSREGLIILGVDESKLPKSSQISGSQYSTFCKLADEVRLEIAKVYPIIEDLFTLDFLLYFAVIEREQPIAAKPKGEKEEIKDFEHDAVIDQVLELGDGLGFEVQKEFFVLKGCRIDAIWRSRIANLGTIAYAFEIHRKGSRDSAILNLQRVKRDPSIQKVVIVSTADELERFRGEIASLDEGFRTSVGYFEVSQLQSALDNLQSLKETLKVLGLLQTEMFPS